MNIKERAKRWLNWPGFAPRPPGDPIISALLAEVERLERSRFPVDTGNYTKVCNGCGERNGHHDECTIENEPSVKTVQQRTAARCANIADQFEDYNLCTERHSQALASKELAAAIRKEFNING